MCPTQTYQSIKAKYVNVLEQRTSKKFRKAKTVFITYCLQYQHVKSNSRTSIQPSRTPLSKLPASPQHNRSRIFTKNGIDREYRNQPNCNFYNYRIYTCLQAFALQNKTRRPIKSPSHWSEYKKPQIIPLEDYAPVSQILHPSDQHSITQPHSNQ